MIRSLLVASLLSWGFAPPAAAAPVFVRSSLCDAAAPVAEAARLRRVKDAKAVGAVEEAALRRAVHYCLLPEGSPPARRT